MMKTLAITMLLLGMASLAYADEDDASKSPLGCRDSGYQFSLNVLNIVPETPGDHQSLYFVFLPFSTTAFGLDNGRCWPSGKRIRSFCARLMTPKHSIGP